MISGFLRIRRKCDFLRVHQALPQQLPGPAQPACPGEDPQQAVSPGPGRAFEDVPDKEEWADIIFFRLLPPHCGQTTLLFSENTKISDTWPQSAHK
ncbi:hypothetical protein DESC_480188 [Desulfosarcina cetonica]|nr:hypothetical protein DESC_480188 [Desulfosarcina cetonica]